MGELLDFIFICILIYYVLKILFRWLAPMMFEKVVNKAQEQQQRQQQYYSNNQQQQYYSNTQQQQRQQYYNRTDAGTGKIKVDYVPPKKTMKKGSIPDSEGDFVDYEEVK